MPAKAASVAKGAWAGWLAMGLALASCLPVLAARYPQMSDYPAHLARYAVMLDGGHNADLARYYGFRWAWTGNVGVDLLIRPFAALFGLEGGGRVIAGLIPPLTGFGLIAVDVALRRRITVASVLAMPFIWSPMMLIGLLNFALGQGLALWVFALWVALGRERAPLGWHNLLFVPLGLMVWLCHLSAWGVLCILVFFYEVVVRGAEQRRWVTLLTPWPLAAPLVVMALNPGTAGTFAYGAHMWNYKTAIWLKAMRDTAFEVDLGGLMMVGLGLLLALVLRRLDWRLGWAGLVLLVLSIAVPRHISGGDYADYRLITSGLMVCCLAVDWAAPAWFWLAAAGHVALRLALTTQDWAEGSAQTAVMLGALDHVPQGARIASAVVVDRSAWPLNHFEHIGAYAVWRRHALVNANFAVPHVHMLQVKEGGPGFVDPSHRLLVNSGQKIDMAAFAPARHADYLWYVGARAPDTMPAGAVVVWRGGQSFLARLPGRAGETPVPLAKSAPRD